MNTDSFQPSEEDRLIRLEEQSEISCLVRRFAIEQFGYSRMRISSPELMRRTPQPKVNIALSKRLIDLYLRFGTYSRNNHNDKKYIVFALIGF